MSLIQTIISKSPRTIRWAKTEYVSIIRTISMRDAPIINVSEALANPEEVEQKNKLSSTILVPTKVDVSPINGVPSEHIKSRRVCIHMPPKNAMQSGTNNINHWQIQFDTRERWENPLMGWTSTGDPLSNMEVGFNSKEEAIEYCEKNNWRWFIHSEDAPKKERVKNYGVNFAWNKRTRVSTK